MATYGGPTPKRHVAYSNSPAIQSLYKHVQSQDAAGIDRVRTVKKYIDKEGKQRFKGDKGLRPSESEPYLILEWNRSCVMTSCL